MSSERSGLDCYFYRNTGSHASPTWNEVSCVRDLTLPKKKTRSEFSSRGTGGYKAFRGAMKELDVQGEVIRDHSDADYLALLDSFENDTILDCLFLDGPVDTAGSKGWRLQMIVFDISDKEPLDGPSLADLEMSVAYDTAHPPVRYTAA